MDDSAYPLIIQYHRYPPVVEDYAWLEGYFHRVHERKSRYLVIGDTTSTMPDAATRQRISLLIENLEVDSRRYCIGSILIVRSAIARAALMALGWMSKKTIPQVAVPTWSDAATLAHEWFVADGIAITPDLEAKLDELRRRDAA